MCGSRSHHRRTHDRSVDTRARHDAEPVVTTAPGVRVSTPDRERVVEQLRAHAADGRLTLDEFGDRVEETYEARTGAELAGVLRELPRVRVPAEVRAERRSEQHALLLPIGVMVLLVVIWASTGGFPWPVFPFFFWVLPALLSWRSDRVHHRAAADV